MVAAPVQKRFTPSAFYERTNCSPFRVRLGENANELEGPRSKIRYESEQMAKAMNPSISSWQVIFSVYRLLCLSVTRHIIVEVLFAVTIASNLELHRRNTGNSTLRRFRHHRPSTSVVQFRIEPKRGSESKATSYCNSFRRGHLASWGSGKKKRCRRCSLGGASNTVIAFVWRPSTFCATASVVSPMTASNVIFGC